MRQEVVRAENANKAAREYLRRLFDDRPGVEASAILVTRASLALSENLEALREIDRICRNQTETAKED
jgi:predicted Zn-dependent protease